jgi:predicted amidohydrolase
VKAAAIQLEARVADVAANLEACERLADEAGSAGAECIVLPEFFTTGIGFVPELADAALPPDGEATSSFAARASPWGNGGRLIPLPRRRREVRNAFLLATADGEIAGRHDKDLPTMWRTRSTSAAMTTGVIEAGTLTIGAAVCWERCGPRRCAASVAASTWR